MRSQKNPATLLSDECIPELINIFLETNQITVLRVRDLNLASQPDEVVFKKAQSLKLPILTLDVRFVGQVYQQESYTHGLILLRYKGKVKESLLKNIKQFIGNQNLNKLQDTVVVIDEQKIRISKKSTG